MRSAGMHLISSLDMKRMVLVPSVSPNPCARRPNYFAIVLVHTSCRSGSLVSCWYLVIVSCVIGWTTPLHNSSISMAGLMVSLDASRERGIVIVMAGTFVYPTPMMWYNASWLIAAGAFCLNWGDGLC